ncbi:tumor necrosis factor receptor superfamily member 25 isoform X1 [Saimiri boliviensis]|nr:tumor necrosis factor receptor superfamily member 25 isoform X1 [Saimiri boliviensis boliviensis]
MSSGEGVGREVPGQTPSGSAAPPLLQAGASRWRGAGPAGVWLKAEPRREERTELGSPWAPVGGPSAARRAMEQRPRGCVTAAVAAALLLLLLVPQAQGGTRSPRCDCAGDFYKKIGLFCCRGCPAGYYLKSPCTEPCGNSTCLPCPRDSFLAWENHHHSECARCQVCDEQASQVALKNCSAVADTHCGCKPGWFVECQVSQCISSSPFYCRPCLDCGALHRHTRPPCSRYDTDCGTCLPGFYEHRDACVSCPTSSLGSCPERCATVCGWRQMFWVQVLLAGLVFPLLLGATMTYTYRHCWPHKPRVTADEAGMEALTPPLATHLSPSDSVHTLLAPSDSSEKISTVQLVGNGWTPAYPQSQEVLCPQVTWSWDQIPNRALGPAPVPRLSPESSAGSPAVMLQPGPQLYDVMDAVPARRWKEFVRTLGLREAEIEAVEVEIGRFRDQQYEMLKRWRQQQPAGLSAVYAALERMGLDGCAEDLRSRLQRGP